MFADVLERDLGRRRVFGEAIHVDGRAKERRWRRRGLTIGETYKPFSKEAEPEKEGKDGMSLKSDRRICATAMYGAKKECISGIRIRKIYPSTVPGQNLLDDSAKPEDLEINLSPFSLAIFCHPSSFSKPHVRSMTSNYIHSVVSGAIGWRE